MKNIHITKDYKETQKLGQKFAQEVLSIRRLRAPQDENNRAIIFGLSGNLGGGKTTFLQGFAKGLGIKEKILSPTFVIMKHFENFYHIDCYRLKDEKNILELGWKEIISNPKNIVAIEWSEKIKKVLPKDTIFINFKFIDNKTREIRLSYDNLP